MAVRPRPADNRGSGAFSSSGPGEPFVPRTPLGKRLLALRRKAIREGMKLLSENEVLAEVRRRRGESVDDEADLC